MPSWETDRREGAYWVGGCVMPDSVKTQCRAVQSSQSKYSTVLMTDIERQPGHGE
jgi:hypothetical protein